MIVLYVYLNGEVQPVEEATLSIMDHGLMYGLGLFETFRVFDGHPFLLDDHFYRLEKSAREMNIAWSYDRQAVLKALHMTLEANEWNNAYVRYNITAGMDSLGLTTEKYTSPQTIIYMKPLPSFAATFPVKRGQLLSIRRNTPEGHARLKSHHFFNNVLGKREIGEETDVEGIFLTASGHVAEGVVSNVFWVKDGTIYTPSVETGILKGITREFILTLAKKHGIYVREGRFEPSFLIEAEEAFAANSIQGIVRLTAVDQHRYSTSTDSLVSFLQKEYTTYCTSLWQTKELLDGKDERK